MIYTLTVSPSIDLINDVNNFQLGIINRAIESTFTPGGKGINISILLKQFNIDSTILGFKANFTGQFLNNKINELNIKNRLIEAEGYTRINVKVISNIETALNTNTLFINNNHIRLLYKQLEEINDDDILIISGNIPGYLSDDFYEKIIEKLNKSIKIIIDCEGNLLLNTLKYKPYLIKPNRDELEKIFNIRIKNIEDAFMYAEILQNKGAKNVIISLDKDGAILLDNTKKKHFVKNLDGQVISSVGAGDSLIAGFLYGMHNKYQIDDAFTMGVAFANATVYSKTLANPQQIMQIYSLLKEKNIK